MIKINKHRKFVVITTAILFSFLFGIFIYSKLSEQHLEFILNHATNLKYITFNTILVHILILNLSFLLSFLGVGIFVLLCYLFFEGVVIGFMTAYFTSLYHLSGIFYSFFYLLIYKFILLFLITLLILKSLKITRSMIKLLKKEKIDITKTVLNTICICILIILYDFILLLFGTNLLNIFSFLIK